MKRRPTLVASLLLVACSSDPASQDTEANDTSSSTTGSETETEAEAGDGDGDGDTTSTTGEPLAQVHGTVVGPDGQGVNIGQGQICGPIMENGLPTLCIPIEEDVDGSWSADVSTAGDYNLKWTLTADDTTTYSYDAERISVADEDITIEQPFKPRDISAFVDLDGAAAGDVDMGDGLVINMDPALMKFPLGLPKHTGGALIDPADWRQTEVGGETIIAIWALAPFGLYPDPEAENPVADVTFVINDALGLEAGATVNFHYLDKDNADVKSVGSGTVNADATAIDPGAGLPAITHLIVTTP